MTEFGSKMGRRHALRQNFRFLMKKCKMMSDSRASFPCRFRRDVKILMRCGNFGPNMFRMTSVGPLAWKMARDLTKALRVTRAVTKVDSLLHATILISNGEWKIDVNRSEKWRLLAIPEFVSPRNNFPGCMKSMPIRECRSHVCLCVSEKVVLKNRFGYGSENLRFSRIFEVRTYRLYIM